MPRSLIQKSSPLSTATLAFLPKVGIYEKGQKARNHETMMVSKFWHRICYYVAEEIEREQWAGVSANVM